MTDPADLILNYYRSQITRKLTPLPEAPFTSVTNVASGLGDAVILTDLPRAAMEQGKEVYVWSEYQPLGELLRFGPQELQKPLAIQTRGNQILNAPDACAHWDCGNGHYFQRLRRAMRLEIDDKPHGCIVCDEPKKENRVVVHFEAGGWAQWQRKHIHPNARELSLRTRKELGAFCASRKDLEFIAVGKFDPEIVSVEHVVTKSIGELVHMIASASTFIGILSGPLHIAVALDLRVITVMNFPEAQNLFFPCLVNSGTHEQEWVSPVSCVLHQESEGALVKKATTQNFQKAFDGEIYPFWRDDWLHLIHEKI